MPTAQENSHHCCPFCREPLTELNPAGSDYARMLLLIKRYKCPHCFEIYHRPFTWVTRLPLVSSIVRTLLTKQSQAATGTERNKLADSQADSNLFRLGRWVTQCEINIGRAIRAVVRAVWSALCFFPKRIFGIRRKKGERTQGRYTE